MNIEEKRKRRMTGDVGTGVNVFDIPRTNLITPFPRNTSEPVEGMPVITNLTSMGGDCVSSTTSVPTSVSCDGDRNLIPENIGERRPSISVSRTSNNDMLLQQILNMTNNSTQASVRGDNDDMAGVTALSVGSTVSTEGLSLSTSPYSLGQPSEPALQQISCTEEANIMDELKQVSSLGWDEEGT